MASVIAAPALEPAAPDDARPPGLADLDDAVLVYILGRLDPLPDLFAVCGVSRRFRRLGDSRLWLRVAGLGRTARGARGHRPLSFETLNEAVLASRPGDTVLLAPGVPHFVADVCVEWPLRLLGGGAAPEDTVLTSLLGGSSAISYRASGMLANLTVCSEQHACVTHYRGRLAVEACALRSLPAAGLEHLFTPLVTLASSPPGGGGGGGRAEGRRQAPAWRPAERGRAPDQAGVLCVRETKIKGKGGMRAVQAAGTGQLAGVRAIPLAAETLFWFEVDSSSRRGPVAAGGGGQAASQRGGLPGWAQAGRPLFAPGGAPVPAAEWGGECGALQLRLKSEAWLGRSVKPRLA